MADHVLSWSWQFPVNMINFLTNTTNNSMIQTIQRYLIMVGYPAGCCANSDDSGLGMLRINGHGHDSHELAN